VKFYRTGAIAGLAVASLLAVAACGSDDNTAGDSGADGKTKVECGTGTITGEGSSAQKNAVEQVISTYQAACSGATVNYSPSGSGAGIKQFIAKQVDWAGSDSALKTAPAAGATQSEADQAKERCGGNEAWNLPMAVGPIAVSYKVDGVSSLVLDAETTAKIFNGKITKWDDAAIAKLNSGAKLPNAKITVFFRSDESGTTENFQKYLTATAPTVWTGAPGKKWAGVGEGKPQSQGVAAAMAGATNAISYLEWSFAKDNKLGIAKIDNGSGPVELTGEAVGKAVNAAKADGTGNDLRLKLDYATKEAGAYPIILVTYEIVCSKGLDSAKTSSLKAFLTYYASAGQQKSLEEIGYAPLPADTSSKVATAIAAIS
jgi:phosphate transport system substrate-binding protein